MGRLLESDEVGDLQGGCSFLADLAGHFEVRGRRHAGETGVGDAGEDAANPEGGVPQQPSCVGYAMPHGWMKGRTG